MCTRARRGGRIELRRWRARRRRRWRLAPLALWQGGVVAAAHVAQRALRRAAESERARAEYDVGERQVCIDGHAFIERGAWMAKGGEIGGFGGGSLEHPRQWPGAPWVGHFLGVTSWRHFDDAFVPWVQPGVATAIHIVRRVTAPALPMKRGNPLSLARFSGLRPRRERAARMLKPIAAEVSRTIVITSAAVGGAGSRRRAKAGRRR